MCTSCKWLSPFADAQGATYTGKKPLPCSDSIRDGQTSRDPTCEDSCYQEERDENQQTNGCLANRDACTGDTDQYTTTLPRRLPGLVNCTCQSLFAHVT